MIYLNWLEKYKKISDFKLFSKSLKKDQLSEVIKEVIQNYDNLNQKYKFNEEINIQYIFEQLTFFTENKNKSLFPIPVGVKDVFNTKVLNTTMGSEIWQGFNAGNNARIVDDIIDNGGIIFSKTTTAEFAVHYLAQTKTLNPRNPGHIPGTSSSGSAVAVASGALPICLGTQTAASIIRPASFCGVYGFKPSFGSLDRTGVLKTCDTLDTLGFLGNELKGILMFFDILRKKGDNYPFSRRYIYDYTSYKKKKTINVVFLTNEFKGFNNYHEEVKSDFEEFSEIISSFDWINVKNLPKNSLLINEMHGIHDIIYTKSLAYYFQKEFEETNKISEIMKFMITKGKEINLDDYLLALRRQIESTNSYNEIIEDIDFILTPSTASPAPLIGHNELEDTGLVWSLFGYPQISLPIFKSKTNGLPFGLQIVSKRYNDFALLDFAERIENYLKCIL